VNPRTLVFQIRRAVDLHGARGALRWAADKARDRVSFAETHVWYELDPSGERPRRALEAGLTLRRGELSDVSILRKLETVTPDEASHRIDEGNQWWLVLDGDQLLFSCWIFPRLAPVLAAPGGEIALPDGMVCLEDSVTTAAARGRGIAPAAWSAIADGLDGDGQRRIVTKVTVENIPSRKAVEKVGFEPVAMMRFKRIGPLSRTFVRALDQQRGRFFTECLDRGPLG
jgi:hypothetical protein